jgi:hypothetical protein
VDQEPRDTRGTGDDRASVWPELRAAQQRAADIASRIGREAPTGSGTTQRGTTYGLRATGGRESADREGTRIRDRAAVRRWQAQRERIAPDGEGPPVGWGTRVWVGPPDRVAPDRDLSEDGLRAAGWTPIGVTADGIQFGTTQGIRWETDGSTLRHGESATFVGPSAILGPRDDDGPRASGGDGTPEPEPVEVEPAPRAGGGRHRAPEPPIVGWRARFRDWLARWFPWTDAPGAEPAHRPAPSVVIPPGIQPGDIVGATIRAGDIEVFHLGIGSGSTRRDGDGERDPVDAGPAEPAAVEPVDRAAAGDTPADPPDEPAEPAEPSGRVTADDWGPRIRAAVRRAEARHGAWYAAHFAEWSDMAAQSDGRDPDPADGVPATDPDRSAAPVHRAGMAPIEREGGHGPTSGAAAGAVEGDRDRGRGQAEPAAGPAEPATEAGGRHALAAAGWGGHDGSTSGDDGDVQPSDSTGSGASAPGAGGGGSTGSGTESGTTEQRR